MKRAALVTTFLASTAWADGPEEHRGLYVRMHLGPAYFSATSDTPELTIKGNGATLGLAVGGSVTENLAIYGEVFDDVASNPTVESGGFEAELDGDSGIVGFGVGIAYYFMPVNLYLAGALDRTTIVVTSPITGENERTKYGTGVNLMLGKEWWVSDNWGLGIAGQFVFAGGMKTADDATTFRASAFGVVFSATYN